jgi:hypothetical protein
MTIGNQCLNTETMTNHRKVYSYSESVLRTVAEGVFCPVDVEEESDAVELLVELVPVELLAEAAGGVESIEVAGAGSEPTDDGDGAFKVGGCDLSNGNNPDLPAAPRRPSAAS